MTDSERARKRATESRLRAYCKIPGRWYTVRNLSSGTKYTVWYLVSHIAGQYGTWECTCPTNNRDKRCKHVQRVMDREEQRIRQEALADG